MNNTKIVVVGLGYVGLPLAISFAEKGFEVIGYDSNTSKLENYKNNEDPTNEVGSDKLSSVKIKYTNNEKDINEGDFIIIAVPTPIYADTTPDLNPVESASVIVGKNLKKGSIVVYESTVYPGVTEEICVPILEKESSLICGKDFKVGYSPERVNPGDKIHTVNKITKIVSGMDEESLSIIADLYGKIIDAGVYKASSIKVAEAAKVIENSQRDINIAFMNELAIIFDKLNIDTHDVLEAAGTKWNFMKFNPGLVGGHCIGVDPYYLTYKSASTGYISQLILAGRRLNDHMPDFIVGKIIERMIQNDLKIKGSKVAVLGLTFKENVPDLRNSKVADIIKQLENYGIEVLVTDPFAKISDAKEEYNIDLVDYDSIKDVDAVILAVAHDKFRNSKINDFKKLYNITNEKPLFFDIKGIMNKSDAIYNGFDYWRL